MKFYHSVSVNLAMGIHCADKRRLLGRYSSLADYWPGGYQLIADIQYC
jgi:hypothetical protein